MEIPLIIYVRGGNKRAPDIAQRGGMLYGTRNDYKAYGDVYMIDIKWKDYDWQKYLNKIEAYRPQIAMVADYEHPSQRQLMYQQIRDLKALGVPRIMVCPKFAGAVAHIPTWCVVAVSVPTEYAGFLPHPSELAGREIHLLGGHPDQQLYLTQVYGAMGGVVISVDGNVLGSKAQRGQYWRADGGWESKRGQGVPTDDLAVMSAVNIRKYFESDKKVFKSRRVSKCMYTGALL